MEYYIEFSYPINDAIGIDVMNDILHCGIELCFNKRIELVRNLLYYSIDFDKIVDAVNKLLAYDFVTINYIFKLNSDVKKSYLYNYSSSPSSDSESSYEDYSSSEEDDDDDETGMASNIWSKNLIYINDSEFEKLVNTNKDIYANNLNLLSNEEQQLRYLITSKQQ